MRTCQARKFFLHNKAYAYTKRYQFDKISVFWLDFTNTICYNIIINISVNGGEYES